MHASTYIFEWFSKIWANLHYRSCMPRCIAVDHMTSGNFLPNICILQFLLYQKYVKTGYSWSHTQLLSPGFQQSQRILGTSESTVYKSHDYQSAFKKKIIYFSTIVTRIDLDFLNIVLGTFTFLPNILLLQFLNIQKIWRKWKWIAMYPEARFQNY